MPGQLCTTSGGGIRNTNSSQGGILVPIGGKGSCGCGSFNGGNCSICTTCCDANGSNHSLTAVMTGSFDLYVDTGPILGAGPFVFFKTINPADATTNASVLRVDSSLCVWSAGTIYIGYRFQDPGHASGVGIYVPISGGTPETYVPASDPTLQPSTVGGNTTAAMFGTFNWSFTFSPFFATITMALAFRADSSNARLVLSTGAQTQWTPTIATIPNSQYCQVHVAGPITWTPTVGP